MTEIQDKLPCGWVVEPVSDLFGIIGGGTPSTENPEYWNGEIPWISSADIDENHQITPRRCVTLKGIEESATNKVPAGSLIVVTRVGLGKVAIAPADLCFSQDSQALLFDPTLVEPRYALFYMSQAVSIFRHISRGTTISGVTKRQLSNLPFRLAPVKEQHRIVAEIEKQFTRLEAAVAALKRVQANLKRYRAAVLKAACEGRLVPTEAELARKEGRSYETGAELLARILQERRAKWEAAQLARMTAAGKPPKDESWKRKYKEPELPDTNSLPLLPEGWTWASLGQVAWEAGYGTSEKCDYNAPGPPVLRIPNIVNGTISLEDLKFATKTATAADTDYLKVGDLLIIRTNGSKDLIGRGAVIRMPFQRPHLFASYLIRYRLVSSVMGWVAAIWDSTILRDQVGRMAATSAGQYNVSIGKLDQLAIPLPPENQQTRIVQELEKQASELPAVDAEVSLQLIRSDRLRQSILMRAFEGKLVPQDPNDEPASVLLERIRAERAAKDNPERRSLRRQRQPRATAATVK